MLARLWRTTSGVVAIATLGFSVATVVVGGIAYEVTHEALEEQLDHRIAAETSSLMAKVSDAGVQALVDAVSRRDSARSSASLFYLLVDENGDRLAGSLIADVPAQGYEELLAFRDGSTGRSGVAQALTTRLAGGTLVVAADRGELNEIDDTLIILFSGAMAAMLFLGALTAVSIGWITRRRLAKIDTTANAIIGGDLSRRIPRDGTNSEFDHLAETLNRMLDRINGLMDNLRQVSTDIAHDLRTPLTRLSNRLETALGESDVEELKHQVAAAQADAGDLLELFSSLLRLAEIEGMADRLPRQRVDLSALLTSIAETYRPDMEEEGRGFVVSIEPGVSVSGDKQLINQLVANLLDNALRHTPKGTDVQLRLERVEDRVILSVADTGPGIEPHEAAHVFQRFVRGEKSRSRAGHGLGLAIVASIAAAHGGSATISRNHPFEIQVGFRLWGEKSAHESDNVPE